MALFFPTSSLLSARSPSPNTVQRVLAPNPTLGTGPREQNPQSEAQDPLVPTQASTPSCLLSTLTPWGAPSPLGPWAGVNELGPL